MRQPDSGRQGSGEPHVTFLNPDPFNLLNVRSKR